MKIQIAQTEEYDLEVSDETFVGCIGLSQFGDSISIDYTTVDDLIQALTQLRDHWRSVQP